MPAIEKPLSEITKSDLQRLVDLGIQEGKEIEYKEYLDLSTDANNHKATFVGEATSFANARGGDLIVGLPEEDGKPSKVAGIPLEKGIDQALEQWNSVLRRQTDPTLPTAAFDIDAIPVEEDRAVVVVRVEQSWRAPHRVALNDRFYGRSPSGKVRLDTGELRRRFRQSEQRAEQAQKFRADRIAKIQARNTPVPLQEGPVLTLHVVPFTAFTPGEEINVEQASVLNKGAPRLLGTRPEGEIERHTLEGLVTCVLDPADEQPAYTLTFRSGAIEAVATELFQSPTGSHERPSIDGSGLRTSLEATLPRFCRFLLRQDVRPPFAVFLTVIGANGYTVQRRSGKRESRHALDRDVAQLPEQVIERIDDPDPEPRTFSSEPGVRPSVGEPYSNVIDTLMDFIWQAVGQNGEPGR